MKAKLKKTGGAGGKGFPFILHPSSFILALLLFASSVPAAAVWTKQRSGTLAQLHAVYFLDQNKGWAVGSNGMLLSTGDGGESWKAMRRPSEDTVRDLYFADEQNGWIVCERNLYLLKTKDEQRAYLMSTKDGGENWRRVNLSGDPDARLLRVIFTTKVNGWVFGEGGMVFATRDGGASWLKKRAPTRHILFGGASLNTAQLWLVGSGATIIQTKDGGETWRTGNILGITEPVRFAATSFVDVARGWAVGNEGKVFLTVDGGRTWDAQKSGVSEDLNDVKFLDAAEGWAVGNGGVLLHTTDGGFHWTQEETGTTHPLYRLFFINGKRGWAVGFGGTILSYGAVADGKAPTRRQAPALKGGRIQ